jgi:hypothetical protein
MDLKFYLNNKLVAPPRNWKEIQIELLFTDDRPSATLQSINFEWVNSKSSQNASLINTWIQQGLNGGVGIFEGMPLKITNCDPSPITIFTGILDLASESAEIECDIVKCPLKESGRIDYLNDRADSFSFAYLASLASGTAGAISTSDFFKTPYTITKTDEEALRIIMLGITLYILEQEAAKILNKIKDDILDIAGAAVSPLILAGKILVLIADMVYAAFVINGIIKLLTELINEIIQFKKYKLCMKVATLFQRGCEYMGLNFSSTILQTGTYKDITIMPRKVAIMNGSYKNPFKRAYNEKNNANAYGYYDGTFKQLIIEMQEYFNASCKVINGTLFFERNDYWQNKSSYKLKNKGKPGYTFNYPDPHGTNAAETPSNYFIIYQTDAQDQNTYNRYTGTSVQVICKPNKIIENKNVLLKNLTQVRLGFSLAKRKDHLNRVEDFINNIINLVLAVINDVITVINALTGIFGAKPIKPIVFKGLTNRFGWIELSSDFTGTQKIFIGENQSGDWKIKRSNENLTSATALLNTFHYINLPTRGNQWLTYKNKTIDLCCKDYMILHNNNYINTHDTKKAKITRLLWNLHKETAEIDYRIQQDYTKNLSETVIVDGKN